MTFTWKPSIRSIIGVILIIFGLVSVLSLQVSIDYFQESAIKSHKRSISKIIKINTNDLIQELRQQSIRLGQSFQKQLKLRDTLKAYYKDQDATALTDMLNSPFINGYPSTFHIELTNLRIYDTNYRLIASSIHTPQQPASISHIIQRKRENTSPLTRLKAAGDLWLNNKRLAYSILIPIGGLRHIGYLEVVTDPIPQLAILEQRTAMPVTMQDLDGQEIFRSAGYEKSKKNNQDEKQKHMHILYQLKNNMGEDICSVTLHDNVETLFQEIKATQYKARSIITLSTALLLFISLFILNHLLFKPIRKLSLNMNRLAHNKGHEKIDTQGAKEFYALNQSFNTMSDILKKNLRDLEYISCHDELSGIANRRQFNRMLEREIKRANRKGLELSLLLCDIDYFKRYNDTYGHVEGDEGIKVVARVIQESLLRPSDLASRYGGEEFAIILPETDLNSALTIAKRIQARLKEARIPHKGSDVSDWLTLSIGVAHYTPRHGIKPDVIIVTADIALYRAKEKGRNRIEYNTI